MELNKRKAGVSHSQREISYVGIFRISRILQFSAPVPANLELLSRFFFVFPLFFFFFFFYLDAKISKWRFLVEVRANFVPTLPRQSTIFTDVYDNHVSRFTRSLVRELLSLIHRATTL